MCSIRQRFREEKRKYDEEFNSKSLRATAYREALKERKNRDISRARRRKSYQSKFNIEGENPRYTGMIEEGEFFKGGRDEKNMRINYDSNIILDRILQVDWKKMIDNIFGEA